VSAVETIDTENEKQVDWIRILPLILIHVGCLGVFGNMSVQHGPIGWAAHHRHHHRFTDKYEDMRFPKQHGL
jgi:fatty-acid desaturase